MKRLAVKFAVWLLKQNLSLKDRATLLNAIHEKLATLPLRRIIQISDDGSLIIRGKKLEHEEERLIRNSAQALKHNRAFGLIQDEVLYTAHSFGVNDTTIFEQIYASKMAVWWGQEEHKYLKILIGENPDLSGQTDL